MKNQSGEIPLHLRHMWSEVSEELRQASNELCAAREQYHSATLARIAFRTTNEKDDALQETLTQDYTRAHDKLCKAHIRYNNAVVARVQLSHLMDSQ